MNRTYFVEGKCEEKVVKALQSQPQLIQDGRVYIVNVMQQKIKKDILRTLNKKSQIVFIYDTDTNNTNILTENIRIIKKLDFNLVLIPQVKNLEDELRLGLNIGKNANLFDCKTNSDIKRHICKATNLRSQLNTENFQINKFWTNTPGGDFPPENNSQVIKIK